MKAKNRSDKGPKRCRKYPEDAEKREKVEVEDQKFQPETDRTTA